MVRKAYNTVFFSEVQQGEYHRVLLFTINIHGDKILWIINWGGIAMPKNRIITGALTMHGVLDYLESTAKRFPDKKAIGYKDFGYSFRELKTLSSQLGAAIAKRSVKNHPVGVIVNRGADTLVLFLACAYSGNYYVPIDPAMPVKKIRAILEDAEIRLILGEEKNRKLLETVEYTGDFCTLEDKFEEELSAPECAKDTPLYLVYTSGSTGTPKGVLKSHGAVMSFMEAFVKTFELGDDEIIGNQTPFFFDASAKDIYLMLKTGATMEVIPSEMFMLPTFLMEYLGERNVTYLCWVPTALAMVAQMNAFHCGNQEHLKNVFFVGEVFPIKQLKRWLEEMPQLRYVNLYGSSELAGICCYYELNGRVPEEGIPMGKPLSNCKLELRDENGPVTVPNQLGEIFIESEALALCYYHDEERTRKSFVTEERNGEMVRVFHSGDLARMDEQGNLVFSSRKDFQIKHLGKRIELGEIESVADSIEEVVRCCCLYDSELQQIKLFCELKQDSVMNAKDIRKLLRQGLSDYMVPQKVILLEKMPFNANGKIDRVALKQLG